MPALRLRDEKTVVGVWLFVGAILLGYFYIQPGWPRMGDGHGALSQTFLFREAVLKGEWPGWSFYWYGGWSFTRAYGPLFSAPSGLLDILLQNPKRSVVLVFLFWHWVALFASYSCARAIGVQRYGALIAALLYAFCGQFSQTILRFGSFNLSLFYALAPLILLFLARSLTADRVVNRSLVLATMLQALSILNHAELGIYSLFGNSLVLILSAWFSGLRRNIGSTLPHLALFHLLSILLSAFFLIQFYVTSQATLLGLESSHLWTESTLNWQWMRVLLSPDYAQDHPWSVQYLGWVGLLLASLGSWHSIKGKNGWGIVFLASLLFGLIAMTFLARLRLLNFFILPFSLLAGMGAEGCIRAIRSRFKGGKSFRKGIVLVSFLALFTLIDQVRLLPHGQYPYRPTAGYFESPETRQYFDGEKGNAGAYGRTLQIRSSLEATSWSDLEPLVTGFPTLAGGNHETAPKSWPHAAAFIRELVRQVHSDEESRVSLEDLSLLLGVRFLAYPNDAPGQIGFGMPIPSESAFRCLELETYSPVIAATTFVLDDSVTPLDRMPGSVAWRSDYQSANPLGAIVENHGFNRATLLAERLLLREPLSLPIPDTGNSGLELTFLGETVSHTRVQIEMECSAPCFLRLAYADDPRLKVFLDGEATETVPTAMHLTGLVCPTAGKHHLEIRAVYLPIEKCGWGLSCAAWLGCLVSLAWPIKKVR